MPDRGGLRLLRPRRHEPRDGDAGLGVARAPSHDRRRRISISDPTLRELAAFLDESVPDTLAPADPADPPESRRRPAGEAADDGGAVRGPRGHADRGRAPLGPRPGAAAQLASALLHHPLAAPVPWWLIGVGYLVLRALPASVLMVMPGSGCCDSASGREPPSRRPGPPAAVGVRAVGGGLRDPLARRHPLGRALRAGARLPRRAQRRPAHHRPGHRMGHARADCAVDPETDLAAGGSRRTRCTLAPSRSGKARGSADAASCMPGARVGAGAVIEPGTCVTGTWSGAGGLGRFACAVRRHRGRVRGPPRSVALALVDAGLHGVAVRVRLDPAARRAALAGHARLGDPP